MKGNDTFVLMATGSGKSICFQIPALTKDGICIVISPLIALMNNQVAELKKRNIKAMALSHSYNHSELSTLLDNCIYGNYKFLIYVTGALTTRDYTRENQTNEC